MKNVWATSWGLLIHLGFGLVPIAQSFEYCKAPRCLPRKHIACNNEERFSPACPSQVQILNMTELKRDILNAHNAYRNRIAGGQIEPFEPAARMATLRWDAELAKLALMNVRKCRLQHDLCFSTAQFLLPGQNLAKTSRTSNSNDYRAIVLRMIDNWFVEHKNATMGNIRIFTKTTPGSVIAHFTQIVRDKATHMGCAAVAFKKDRWYQSLMACNYGVGNILNQSVYERGNVPASKCKTGINEEFKNLCSIQEVYN